MTREEAIKTLKENSCIICDYCAKNMESCSIAYCDNREAIRTLEQQPCEMTAEEYRQNLIQVFHNVDCDELIAFCVLPTENEFKHLEWFLNNHYKKQEPCEEWLKKNYYKQEPCEDCVSRQAVHNMLEDIPIVNTDKWFNWLQKACLKLADLPSVIPKGVTVTDFADKCRECGKQKKGKWEYDPYKDRTKGHCNRCGHFMRYGEKTKFCPDCGTEMEGM